MSDCPNLLDSFMVRPDLLNLAQSVVDLLFWVSVLFAVFVSLRELLVRQFVSLPMCQWTVVNARSFGRRPRRHRNLY